MRLDRSITLNLVQPLRRLLAAPKRSVGSSNAPSLLTPTTLQHSTSPVPILMYHSISDAPEPGVPAYYQTSTSLAVFRQHMEFLAQNGYKAVSLKTLVADLCAPFSPPTTPPLRHSTTPFPRLAAITFDDGFRNFYTEAFSVLQQHGFTATMFLSTAFIGDTPRRFCPVGSQSKIKNQKSKIFLDCLKWTEVLELHRAGIEFGSHSVNHPRLVELDWPAVRSEICESKSEIEQRLGEGVTTFCYPYAFPQADRQFAGRFAQLLRETGYRCCATTELGRVRPGDDPFRLKRLPANSLDDPALFAAKLDGAYDWLGSIQSLSKKLRRLGRPLKARPQVPAPDVGALAIPNRRL
ncbi:MAG TPA: polysaccharide deacetylase family protein [Verrucomicrobiae bacterium]|nr:polysaccharide deacetylase family protein [Verrucomicrobiae bacterium]